MTENRFVEHWNREYTWACSLKKMASLLEQMAESIRWQDTTMLKRCLNSPDFEFQTTVEGPDDLLGMFRVYGEVLDAADIFVALMKERHQATFNVEQCSHKMVY